MKRTRWLVKLLILLALPITAGCAAAVVAGGAAVGTDKVSGMPPGRLTRSRGFLRSACRNPEKQPIYF